MLAAQRWTRPAGAARQVLVVAAVLALLLALLALLTSLGGTSQFGDARTGGLVDGPIIRVPEASGEQVDERVVEPPPVRPPAWLPVLLVLVVTLVLALAVRSLMRSPGGAVEDPAAPPPVGDAEGDPEAVVLDDLRATALAAAEDVRRDGAGAADAVVRCWERLEEHGARLGTPRAAHETPTEYGSDLLRRHGADPGAVDDLLHLFHQARFGRGGLPAGADERAAAALVRVAGTLHPDGARA